MWRYPMPLIICEIWPSFIYVLKIILKTYLYHKYCSHINMFIFKSHYQSIYSNFFIVHYSYVYKSLDISILNFDNILIHFYFFW